jgi:hypothetical protein
MKDGKREAQGRRKDSDNEGWAFTEIQQTHGE